MNELFLKNMNMSISVSWLILAVLILRLTLKKAPKWVNVLLWGIVAVRLICPFTIESALSLIPNAETIPLNIEMDATPAIDSGVDVVNSIVNPVISASLTPHPAASANPLQVWIPLVSILWAVGIAVFLLYTTISYWRLRRRVDTAILCRDNIFQSENVGSPFVLGIIKPSIYVPFDLEGQNMEHVVAHEQAHIRRKDHLWKPLGFLLLTIHWFNPLMWLAYVLLCRDIELACDEKVIKELGSEQRADYTQALVACSVDRRMIAACPLAFGEIGVKERVKSVMNYKKPGFWIVILSVVACMIVAVCFLTNPKQDSYSLRIVVPAGNQEEVVYAEEEISPLGNYIIVTSGTDFGDMEVSLKPVQVKTETAYDEPAYLTPGLPVRMSAEKGGWFKIGVNMQNDTNVDKIVYVTVENVEVRIEDEVTPDKISFQAEILEIYDGYFLVKPESSWAINSADQIEVPMKHMNPALELQVGDIIEISYSGEILETYPARLSEVHSIKVICETTKLSLNDVIILSQYGYDLGWSDFEQYDYIETGSGLYIRVYEINELFELWIGSAGPDSDPMYIYLALADDIDTKIDIRDGGVTEFISEHNSGSAETWDLIPMVMVNGTLYLDTGRESTVDARCGVMDGEITSQVGGNQKPTKDNQSNFGTGFGYQYGASEGTIELYMNDKWWIFATEEARQEIQFPSTETVFELNFAGNFSLDHKLELTADKPYWCVSIVNDGNYSIKAEIAGDVYTVEPGTSGNIYPDEAWTPGTYAISFSTSGIGGMEGRAIGKVSTVRFAEEEPLAWQLMIDPVKPKTVGDEKVGTKYYLTIGADGVKSIEFTMPNSSGGCETADGSLFKKGERIWLENLDGHNDLRGVTITALDENDEIIWAASIPDGEENKGFNHMAQDDWTITNIK